MSKVPVAGVIAVCVVLTTSVASAQPKEGVSKDGWREVRVRVPGRNVNVRARPGNFVGGAR